MPFEESNVDDKFGSMQKNLVVALNEQLKERSAGFKLPSDALNGGYRLEEMNRMLKASLKHIDQFDQMSLNEMVGLDETIDKTQAGTVAKILTTIWDAAYIANIGRDLVTVVTQDNPSIKIPKESRMEWLEHSTGRGDGARSQADTTFAEWSVKKYRSIVGIEQDMIDDAAWGVIQRQLMALGRSYGEFETNLIIDTLYSGRGQNVTGAGTLTVAKVNEAWRMLQRYPGGGTRTPTHLVISPEHYEDAAADSSFQNILYHRPDLAGPDKMQGIVGFLPGNIKVMTSPALDADTSMLICQPYAGVHLIRQDANLSQIDDPLNDLVRAKGTARVYPSVVEANCIVGIHA